MLIPFLKLLRGALHIATTPIFVRKNMSSLKVKILEGINCQISMNYPTCIIYDKEKKI